MRPQEWEGGEFPLPRETTHFSTRYALLLELRCFRLPNTHNAPRHSVRESANLNSSDQSPVNSVTIRVTREIGVHNEIGAVTRAIFQKYVDATLRVVGTRTYVQNPNRCTGAMMMLRDNGWDGLR